MRKKTTFEIILLISTCCMLTIDAGEWIGIGVGPTTEQYCVNEEFENYGCECGRGYYQPISDSFACKNGIYSLDCNLNQTRIESINKLDYLIALVEETSSVSEVCWSAFEFANALKLSSHSFSYLQFRPIGSHDPAGTIRLRLKNVFEIDSFAFSSIKLRASDTLSISLENSGVGIYSSLILKPRCFGGIKSCKRFQIRNFYQLSKLYLKTSYFDGSEIETLWIENVNDFGGFETDLTNQTTGYVRNLVINKCYIKSLRMHTIGAFDSLRSVQLTWTGLTEIEPDSFGECCHGLRALNLANNLLVSLNELSLNGLTFLESLSLENNPLEWLDPGVFDPARSSLIRLNLKSTRIKNINEGIFNNMAALTDLILANTNELELADDTLEVILSNSPRLEYLDLSASRVLSHEPTLNPLLDKLDELMSQPYAPRDLKFIDLTASASVFLNDTQFRASFGRRGQCLWRSLLDRVFVRLDSNHPCDCTLFYFYRNLINYNFPIMNYSWAEDVKYYKLESYENTNVWSSIVTNLMPKCYASFWLQTFSFDLIKKFESQCGFMSDHEFDLKYNCSIPPTSLSTSVTTTATEMSRTSRELPTTSSFSTTQASQKDLFLRREIMSNYSLPIVFGVIGCALLSIALIIFKTRYDYKNKFLKIYEKTLSSSSSKEPKELDLIL